MDFKRKWEISKLFHPKEKRHETRRSRRSYRLKYLYGITEEQAIALLDLQEYLCAACLEPLGANEEFHVEHCHDTGEIRGVTHGGCNRALAQVGHSPEKLRLLANYLEFTQNNKLLISLGGD